MDALVARVQGDAPVRTSLFQAQWEAPSPTPEASTLFAAMWATAHGRSTS